MYIKNNLYASMHLYGQNVRLALKLGGASIKKNTISKFKSLDM